MCGFAGFLSGQDMGAAEGVERLLATMGEAIAHRGPDSAGTWFERGAGIALVHRRLAIVDLSEAGRQPMHGASGRHVLAFNGEIYNHLELRQALARAGRAPAWRGHSDTETLLAAIAAWGLREALQRSHGMFALALWDRQTRTLSLARDRLGEKPLYYGWQQRAGQAAFLFASELKALKPHPAFAPAVDRGALALLMRHNYIPAPHAIYQGIAKLPPGCLLTLSLDAPEPRLEAYWDSAAVARAGLQAPLGGDAAEAIGQLEHLALAAVRRQMMADVPLGAFLSGGIDSSTVVALMQAQSSRPVKTFTIGFHEAGYDEAGHARAVARHLGTEHTELYVSPEQAMAVIPGLPRRYDEPFADSSQIPTCLVSALAREQVTVSLSGDGGDELFGGYSRYARVHKLWRLLEAAPPALRRLLAGAIGALSPAHWNRALGPLRPLLPARQRNPGDKLHKLAALLDPTDFADFYLRFITHWPAEPALVIGADSPPYFYSGGQRQHADMAHFPWMMLADTLNYLPDDILVKVDRAAMGVSLETRLPLLDPALVAFAWRLPLSLKLRDGQGKWILRQLLYKYVPPALVDRPKMGFGVPLGDWLRGPLRDWAEALLDPGRLHREGYFHPAPIRRKWAEHLSGQRNWQYHLWDVLMFQAWLEANP